MSKTQRGILSREILEQNYPDLSDRKGLHMKNQKWRKIEADTFNELNQLKELDLSENLIEKIVEKTFANLSNLKKLYLHNNFLTKIAADTFKDLNQLEELYLHNNQIEKIAPGTFDGLRNVRVINLYSNRLSVISRGTFQSLLSSVGFIDLRENNFSEESPLVSFYDKSIMDKWNFRENIFIGNKSDNPAKISDYFPSSFGFSSDFNDFLSQFLDFKRNYSFICRLFNINNFCFFVNFLL